MSVEGLMMGIEDRSRRNIILLCLFLLCSFIMSGCGNSRSHTQNSFQGTVSDNIITFYADLTHDGRNDRIDVDIDDILSDTQLPALVKVIDQEEQEIWTGSVAIPHMGWGYYYLVSYRDKAYILFYLPDESQGDIFYTLRLFHFDSEGKQVIDDEYKISYDTAEQWESDLRKFEKRLNQYLEESVLLVSVFDFSLDYYGAEQD